ncbi:MAG: methyltransferase domain-containing protein [Pirellulales bacterium]|nr:methyltransferase domain-containing protein [Pirellulales bacterium]
MGILRDYSVFLKQFVRRYHTTGSITPSGRSLAQALCRFVEHGAPPDHGARKILEVGPGTGAVTAQLVEKLRPTDRLTLVELNEDFVRHLHGRFAHERDFQAVAERSNIVHGALEDLPSEPTYDLIVSGLPLNNFSVAEVEQILGIFERLLTPGGTLSFFEYIAIRRVKAVISSSHGRERLRGIGRALQRTLDGREIKRDWVWPNLPPAWVHHVRFEQKSGSNANGA